MQVNQPAASCQADYNSLDETRGTGPEASSSDWLENLQDNFEPSTVFESVTKIHSEKAKSDYDLD